MKGSAEVQEKSRSQNRIKCWRSEIGIRLEDSQTWGKDAVRGGQEKARDDVAKLHAADTTGLVPALKPRYVISGHYFIK